MELRSANGESLHQCRQRLAFLNDVGRKLGGWRVTDVPGRMHRPRRHEQYVARLEPHGLASNLIFQRAGEDVDDLLAGMGVPRERRSGSEIDPQLDGLVPGNTEVVPLKVGARGA